MNKLKGIALTLATTALVACGPGQKQSNFSSSSMRTTETENLLANLKKVSSKGIMFGHHDDTNYGIGWDGEEGRSDVKSVCGDYPAVISFDLGHIELGDTVSLDNVPFSKIRQEILNQYKREMCIRDRFLAEECPHGHMAIGTTVFPTSIGQASTWNPELIRRMGRAIATEASAQGAHIGYGPVLDLARDPRWSRVEETYGEDAYLNGVMGAALVKGFQGEFPRTKGKVIATLKHFAAYGWTEGGHNGGSAHVGNREMEEACLLYTSRCV